jgi:CheY-like chemotaxis protein
LVEDSLINQAVMTAMLHSAGHKVDLADCGTKGIEAASVNVYDIILMDVSMPDMSGMEATTKIRQLNGPNALVPIIAVTAHALAGYKEMCLAAGMNGYATKPINQRQLQTLLATWCAKTETQVTERSNTLVEDSPALAIAEPAIHIDESILAELTNNLGEKQVKELLQIYVTQLNAHCENIKKGIIQNDLSLISREGHTIKSSSATFGMASLQAAGKDLEACGYRDDLSNALIIAEHLLRCAEVTMQMIKLRIE